MTGTKEKEEFVDSIRMRQPFPGNFISETSTFFNVVSKPDLSLRQGTREANHLNWFVLCVVVFF